MAPASRRNRRTFDQSIERGPLVRAAPSRSSVDACQLPIGCELRHRSAVAAVREHDNANILGELRPQLRQFIVEQLAIVKTPCFVLIVPLVPIEIRRLPAMARVAQHENVAAFRRGGSAGDLLDHSTPSCSLCLERRASKPLLPGDRAHVVRVLLAGLQRAAPSDVVLWIHPVKPDGQRPARRRRLLAGDRPRPEAMRSRRNRPHRRCLEPLTSIQTHHYLLCADSTLAC